MPVMSVNLIYQMMIYRGCHFVFLQPYELTYLHKLFLRKNFVDLYHYLTPENLDTVLINIDKKYIAKNIIGERIKL